MGHSTSACLGPRTRFPRSGPPVNFCALLPTELGTNILMYLSPRDVARIACVSKDWRDLVDSPSVWREICERYWNIALPRGVKANLDWKEICRMLVQSRRIFNSDPSVALDVLRSAGLIAADQQSTTRFLLRTRILDRSGMGRLLAANLEIMTLFVQGLDVKGLILPEAMRRLFARVHMPCPSGSSLGPIMNAFTDHYCASNVRHAAHRDAIYVLCFALLLLSVDLHNPHIKNKMSKREFVRNNRTIDTLDALDDDFLGQLYDNVYLFGHVAEPQERTPAQRLLDRSLG